jgi:hypothetical protein
MSLQRCKNWDLVSEEKLVFGSPVLGLPKNRDWTGPRPEKDRNLLRPVKTKTAVRSSVHHNLKYVRTDQRLV